MNNSEQKLTPRHQNYIKAQTLKRIKQKTDAKTKIALDTLLHRYSHCKNKAEKCFSLHARAVQTSWL